MMNFANVQDSSNRRKIVLRSQMKLMRKLQQRQKQEWIEARLKLQVSLQLNKISADPDNRIVIK